MADSTGKLITIAVVGGGAYLAWKYLSAPSVSPVPPVPTGGTTTTTTTTGGTSSGGGTTTTGGTTATTNPAGSADAIYVALKAAAGTDPNFTGSGDSLTSSGARWGFYLQRVVPGASLSAPVASPDLSSMGIDLGTNYTAAAFWAAVAPWVRSTYGLTGLGALGALGNYARMKGYM